MSNWLFSSKVNTVYLICLGVMRRLAEPVIDAEIKELPESVDYALQGQGETEADCSED